MVFYRKYRPQTLNQLIGQDHIRDVFKKAVTSGNLAHAYLFCGPRGTGKTSTARILAKIVNCEKKMRSDNTQLSDLDMPCNECDSCLSITDGSNLDLMEIDAASNRGIDDIRSLRENIKLSPTSAQKKVYIIDEVHMLTTEAFNALLKTLEEPPNHVLFILATTDAHKIPQTILSRVQRLDFQLASNASLLVALKKVIAEEKLAADQEALQMIAKKSEGSFRDCLKLLDQLASFGQTLTVDLVESILKSGSFSDLSLLLDGLADKDITKSLNQLTKQVEKGINLKEFSSSLIDLMRSVLLIKAGALEIVHKDFGGEKYQTLDKIAAKFTNTEIIKIINLLITACEKMRNLSLPVLALEVAIVEICLSSETSAVVAERVSVENGLAVANQEPTLQIPVNGSIIAPVALGIALDAQSKLLDNWTYILETIKPYNFSLEALLKQAKILSCEAGVVLLEVPYSFHQRILEAPKSRDLLESVLSDVLGQPTKVSCMLGNRPVRVEELANVELAADDEVIRLAAEIFNS